MDSFIFLFRWISELDTFSTKPNNISASADLYTLPRYALTGDYMRDLLKMYGIWKYIKGCCEKITRTFKA